MWRLQMWCYRHAHPFGGWGILAFLMSCIPMFLTILIGGFFWYGAESPWADAVWFAALCVSSGVIVLTMLGVFIRVHWLTREEREQIADAEQAEWQPVTQKTIWAVQERAKDHLLGKGIFYLLIAGGCAPGTFLTVIGDPEALESRLVLYLIGFLVFLFLCIPDLLWLAVDGSADQLWYSADHSYRVPPIVHPYGKRWHEMLVLYLPDGRYRLLYKESGTVGSICFVRCRGLLCWVPSRQF